MRPRPPQSKEALMPVSVRVLLALAVLAAGTTLVRCQNRPPESSYFPHQLGTRWTYQLDGKKVLVQVSHHSQAGAMPYVLLETFADGSVLSREQVAVTEDGFYRCTLGGEKYDPPVCILKRPPPTGARWKFESKFRGETQKGTAVQDEADVQVPAGKYHAVRVQSVYKMDEQEFVVTGWYAAGVGLVKQVVKAGAAEMTLELEKFEPAPH
jgi:hypothetical protein